MAKSKKPKKAVKSKSKAAPSRAKAKTEASGRLVEIDLKLPLTDAEARKRSKLAWEKRQEKEKLILERKDVANRYKARIDALTAEESKLLEESSEGLETRTVKATEVKNHDSGMMQYFYKGELRLQRPMNLAEKQQDELPLKQPKTAPVPKVSAEAAEDEEDVRPRELRKEEMLEEGELPAGSKVTRAPRLHSPSQPDPIAAVHEADEQAKREDVADVIQQETSARSKWSMTDGVRQ